jgi:DNA replication protein DnaC
MAKCLAELAEECPRCGGEGIVTQPGRVVAEATLCPHLLACSTCRGSGFRPGRDAQGYDVMKACELVRIKTRAQLFSAAQIPARYHDATLASFDRGRDESQAVAFSAIFQLYHALESLVQPGGHLPMGIRGIGLSGGPGVGKTHLLVAMARALVLDLGVAVRFTDFSQLLWSLKAGFDAGQGEDALIAPLVETEVLFIDELGKGRATEWELSILDAIISARYNRRRTTFFATNHPLEGTRTITDNEANQLYGNGKGGDKGKDRLKLESLGDRVGPRVASRLAEMCQELTVQGRDARTLPVPPSPRTSGGFSPVDVSRPRGSRP